MSIEIRNNLNPTTTLHHSDDADLLRSDQESQQEKQSDQDHVSITESAIRLNHMHDINDIKSIDMEKVRAVKEKYQAGLLDIQQSGDKKEAAIERIANTIMLTEFEPDKEY